MLFNRFLASSLLLSLAASGCDDGAESFDLDVSGPAEVEFGPSSQLTVSLYGRDTTLADVPATLLETFEFPLAARPDTVTIVVPKDARERIEFVGKEPLPAEDVGFYLVVQGDIDGDGQICPGELIRAGGSISFGPEIPSGPVAVALIVKDAKYGCRPAFE